MAILAAAGLVGVASCSTSMREHAGVNQAVHASGLANVHRLNEKIISGGVPEGDAAFEELRAMGVRTILSVDGATPDVAAAESRGMRYVHIPVTYAEVSEAQRLEIARAIRDLPGPVYVHCHHGKHRAPAAAAAAGVALGWTTPDEGVEFMKVAGTSPEYGGLYACVAEANVASAMALAGASTEFPAVHKPRGMVACMVEADEVSEHLSAIQAAGWTVPRNSPDLIPAAEAGRLADSLRLVGEDPKSRTRGADFDRRLEESVKLAARLEDGIVQGVAVDELNARWKAVSDSCKSCHAEYRNKRKP